MKDVFQSAAFPSPPDKASVEHGSPSYSVCDAEEDEDPVEPSEWLEGGGDAQDRDPEEGEGEEGELAPCRCRCFGRVHRDGRHGQREHVPCGWTVGDEGSLLIGVGVGKFKERLYAEVVREGDLDVPPRLLVEDPATLLVRDDVARERSEAGVFAGVPGPGEARGALAVPEEDVVEPLALLTGDLLVERLRTGPGV